MGRPPDCGCCGNNPGLDPVLTCNTNYFTNNWSENHYGTTSSFQSPFVPSISGELVQIRWTNPNWESVYGGADRCCSNEELPCQLVGTGVINNFLGPFTGGVACSYNNDINYNFFLEKTFNVESGVKIYCQITTAQNPCIDTAIFINGTGIASINSSWYGAPATVFNAAECVNTMCDYGEIILNSGNYIIAISGSSENIVRYWGGQQGCSSCCIPLKGFIDYLIIPCSNAQNITGVKINSETNFRIYPENNPNNSMGIFSYETFCSNGAINGIDDFCEQYDEGRCYDCYLQCTDCDSWYNSHSMPGWAGYSGNWWNYNPLLDPVWIAACSGSVVNFCGPASPEDSGRFSGNGPNYLVGNGWAITLQNCTNNYTVGTCYDENGNPYTIYYDPSEQIGACCINGRCCEITCKACYDAGGDWNGVGSMCFGENPVFCSDPGV